MGWDPVLIDLAEKVEKLTKTTVEGYWLDESYERVAMMKVYDEDSEYFGTFRWICKRCENPDEDFLLSFPHLNIVKIIDGKWILYECVQGFAADSVEECLEAAQEFSSSNSSSVNTQTTLEEFTSSDKRIFDSCPKEIRKRSRYWYSAEFARLYNSLHKSVIHGKLTRSHVLIDEDSEEDECALRIISFDNVREDVLIMELVGVLAFGFLDAYFDAHKNGTLFGLVKKHFPNFKKTEMKHIRLFVEFGLYYVLQGGIKNDDIHLVREMYEKIAELGQLDN